MDRSLSMAYDSPELLLPSLNGRCLRLLQVADALCDADDQKAVESLKSALRKLRIVELLHQDRYVVAVAGLQGSGKSTLMKQLFDLRMDGLFPENIGRGERIPILISQANGKDRSCGVKRFVKDTAGSGWTTESVRLTEGDFEETARNPSSDDILLELDLPISQQQPTLPPHLAFLLLPGFEQKRDSRKEGTGDPWQDVMEVSLACSASCIFVFDRTRFSDARNRQLLDQVKRSFRSARPIFVLAKSDQEADQNRELREKVIQQFDVHEPERVICTGTSTDLQQRWKPTLINALRAFTGTPDEFRSAQLEMLRRLVKDELRPACSGIGEAARSLNVGVRARNTEQSRILEKYDEATGRITREFTKAYSGLVDARHRAALDDLMSAMADTGILDRLRVWWKDVWNGPAEVARAEQEILRRWRDALGYGEAEELILALNHVVAQHFRFKGVVPPTHLGPGCDPGELPMNSLVVYRCNPEQEVQCKPGLGETRDEGFLLDVAFLIGPTGLRSKSGLQGPTSEIMKYAQLLPALALEYTRLATILPATRNEDGAFVAIDFSRAVDQLGQEFDTSVTAVRRVLGGIGLMMGVDGAVDGKIDSIPALAKAILGGSTAAGAGTAAAVVASGTAAILTAGVAAGCVVAEANRHALKKDAAFKVALGYLREQTVQVRVARVTDSLQELREVVADRLRDRCGLTAQEGRLIRLEHAVEQVREACADMVEAINQHPSMGLALGSVP